MKRILLLLSFLMLLSAAYSQDNKFTLGLEYRPRGIFNHGYQSPKPSDIESIISVSQRTRINLGFERDKLKTYLSVQDVRLWGDDNNYNATATLGNSESLRIHQAWFSLQLNPKMNLKVGRQVFNYDDERILSGRRWLDYQVTYDAVLLRMKKENCKLDIGLSWNAESTKHNMYSLGKLRMVNFVRYETQKKNINLSAIALISGMNLEMNSGSVFVKGTYGVNAVYSNHNFDIKSSFYYQHNLNDKANDVSAYSFSFHAKQKLCDGKFAWGLGIDYLSGQDEIAEGYTGKMHNFDRLYGVRHGAYGYMDMFNITPLQGLNDCMLKTAYKFSDKASIHADFHWFSLNKDRTDLYDVGNLDKNLGQELDLTLKWKLMKDVKLQTGASLYFTTRSFKQVKNVDTIDTSFPFFGYVMISVNTKIFEN